MSVCVLDSFSIYKKRLNKINGERRMREKNPWYEILRQLVDRNKYNNNNNNTIERTTAMHEN